jgi:hypothetical protein
MGRIGKIACGTAFTAANELQSDMRNMLKACFDERENL